MFSKKITQSDNFLDMPVTSRLLYYDLSMEADDDGFVDKPKMVMRITGASEDDLKLLIVKSFVIPFESGVVVIKHWRINNYLRTDRYHETIYKEEKSQLKLSESGTYELMDTTGIPNGNRDKIRLDKNSIDKNSVVVVEDNRLDKYINNTTTTNLFEFIENIFGRPLGGTEIEIIQNWEDNELTRYAIKQAELSRVFNVKYIQKILYSYKKDNIQTVAEAEEREKHFQESKTTGRSYKTLAERNKEHREQFAKEMESKNELSRS